MPALQTAETPTLEDVACPLCASTHSRAWGAENGFTAVRCAACSLVFVNPRPRLAEISEATRLGEHQTPVGTLAVTYRRSDRKVAHYRHLLGDLLDGEIAQRSAPLDWLDIGAGYGEVMEALATILPLGSAITGIEPMEPKAAIARARGLDVDARPLDTIARRYDGVSLINVFSHLPDPQAFLADVARLLKPGGILVCETGNGGDLASAAAYPDKLDLPDHLVFAGVETMCAFLEGAGFDVTASAGFRRDTVGWVAKNLVKALLRRNVRLTMPHQSPFRTMFFVARRRDASAAVQPVDAGSSVAGIAAVSPAA